MFSTAKTNNIGILPTNINFLSQEIMSFAVELDYSSILKAAVAVEYAFDQLLKNTDNRKYYNIIYSKKLISHGKKIFK